MNLTACLARMYRALRYTSAPPAAVTTRLTDWLNATQRKILTTEGLERLRDDVFPITAYANTARSGLPPIVARINAITDRTNYYSLRQVPLKELRLMDPAQINTTSYPMRYSVIGKQAANLQPATTGLWVASSSASDVTGPRVFAEGVVTGGYPQLAATTGTLLTGTTRAQIGAVTSFIEVTKFYLDLPTVGFISLYDAAAAGNELARLSIGDTYSSYLAVEWWPIPTANVTEYCDCTRNIVDLINGTDEPLLPDDHHSLLVTGALVEEYKLLSDNRLGVAKQEYEDGIDALKAWILDDGDRIASLRRIRQGYNNIGPQFPVTGYW